jgi:hypothetical protein
MNTLPTDPPNWPIAKFLPRRPTDTRSLHGYSAGGSSIEPWNDRSAISIWIDPVVIDEDGGSGIDPWGGGYL